MKKKINLSSLLKIVLYLRFLPAIILKIKNWPVFLLNYMGLKDGKFECIFRNGVKIEIDDNINAATIAVVFIKKDYGDINDNSVAIDIGANIGAYSIFAAQKKNNIVFAFEPMTDNFRLLKENIAINKLEKKIIPYNFAVGRKREKRSLYLGGSPFHSLYPVEDSPFNALYNQEKTEQFCIDINCISLEDIFLENKIENCDMLKMDCEGSEFEILYNLPDEYFKKIRKIRMEYHNHKTKKSFNGEKLAEFLINKGFKIEKFKKSSPYQGDLWARFDAEK